LLLPLVAANPVIVRRGWLPKPPVYARLAVNVSDSSRSANDSACYGRFTFQGFYNLATESMATHVFDFDHISGQVACRVNIHHGVNGLLPAFACGTELRINSESYAHGVTS
jgi:hypothetical protein